MADYKNEELPPRVRVSNQYWRACVNRTLTGIDYEDAHAADRDFENLHVDLSDPISVIGALKYCQKVDAIPIEARAVEMLEKGIHPYTVEAQLMLTERQLSEAVKKVEISGFEIDWNSV